MAAVELVAPLVQEAKAKARPWGEISPKPQRTRDKPKLLQAQGGGAERTATAEFRKFHKFITNPTSVVGLLKNDLICAISQREGAPN